MRRELAAYKRCQVFLNYPFDDAFLPLANAMCFGVVAGGLLPVCAYDITTPDRPRLEMLVEAIRQCHYSVHDFSRFAGEGQNNFARMNMPIEMGMAVFYALDSQRTAHRCAFFVPTPHDYRAFASDLAGLDAKCHHNDEIRLLSEIYDWLRGIVPPTLFNGRPTVEIVGKYQEFKALLTTIDGSGEKAQPSHDETRELMYDLCTKSGWWDWRGTRMGKEEFPPVPLAWKVPPA